MADAHTILLTGLKAPEESFVSAHFTRAGHQVFAAKDISDAHENFKAQGIDLVYVQPSAADRTLDELKEALKDFGLNLGILALISILVGLGLIPIKHLTIS